MSEHQGFEPPAPDDGVLPPAAAAGAGGAGFFADPRRKMAAIVAAALAVGALGGVGLAALADDDEEPRQEGLVTDTSTPTPSASVTPSETASPTPTPTPTASPSASASATASPSASPSASGSASASPSVSPSATAPAGAPVTMSFTLDRTSALIGQKVTARVTVTNPTDKPLTILGDCRNTRIATVEAQLGSGPATPTQLTDRLKSFRDRALEAKPGPVPFESGLGTCPNGVDPTPFTLAPFQSVTDPATWTASSVNGSAYDGTAEVSASVKYRTAARPGVDVVLTAPKRTLRLSGGIPNRLTPAQAVERALADPDFAAAVESSDIGQWPPASNGTGYVEYFGETGTYVQAGREEYEVYLVTGRSGAGESGVSVTVSRNAPGTVGGLTPFSR